jgi:hypothetical protein
MGMTFLYRDEEDLTDCCGRELGVHENGSPLPPLPLSISVRRHAVWAAFHRGREKENGRPEGAAVFERRSV